MNSSNESDISRDRRDLGRGARQILTGFGVRMFARIVLIVFVAKLFGVEVFGRLGEVVAIIELAAAFASFGMTKSLLGEFAKAGDDARVIKICLIEAFILTGAISLMIVFGLAFLWPVIFSADTAPRIVIVGIPLIALTDVALTATRHFRTVAWDTTVKAVIKPWTFLFFALGAYFLTTNPVDELSITSAQGLFGAYTGSLLVSAFVAFVLTARMFPGPISRMPQGREVIAMARRCLPIALNETGVFAFRRVDIILLGLVAGPTATGIYYLAQQIGTVVEKIRYLFEPMLAPIVAQSASLEVIGYHLKRLCLFVFTVQLGLLCIAALFGEELLDVFGSGFVGGAVVLVLILLGELIDGSFGLCELPLIYRHPSWPPRAVALALVIECTLVLTLAQTHGAVGAAVGFVGAMFSLAMIRLALVSRYYNFTVITQRYLFVLVSAIVAAIFASIILHFVANSFAKQIIACLSFVVIYSLLAIMILRPHVIVLPIGRHQK